MLSNYRIMYHVNHGSFGFMDTEKIPALRKTIFKNQKNIKGTVARQTKRRLGKF
jgi:hypothetical protein